MTHNLDFTSEGLGEAAAFDAYRDLYSHGADVSRGRGEFSATVRGWRLDGILLFERHVAGAIHSRGERTARDAFQHIVLTLVIAGRVEGSAESGFAEALPGEIFLADTMKPVRTEYIDVHMITAAIDRNLVEAGLGTSGGLHGRILKAPSNLMLADFIGSLARRGDTLSPAALAPLSRALVDILASVDAFASRASSETRRYEFVRREIVEREIAAQLGDRNLSVETIGDATGISRSALYRLFDSQGGVAKLIQRRRVDALRSALDAHASSHGDADLPPGLTERFGFTSDSQARRLFIDAFDVSPKAYVAGLVSVGTDSPSANRDRWLGWMTEVS